MPPPAPIKVPYRCRRGVAALLVAVLVLVGTGGSGAQEAGSNPGPVTWGVVPSSQKGPDGRSAYDLDLPPGASVVDYVGVSNLSTENLELAVYASDARTTAGGGFDLLPADQPATDVGSWVRFDQPSVVVPPRARVDIPFRLQIPANATPGDHPGGIVASLRAPGDAEGGRVAVDRRVGARIYLRVAGPLAPALQVDDTAVTYQGSLSPVAAGEAGIAYTVRNTGNVRLAGDVRLRVAGPFGVGARTTRLEGIPELLPGAELQRTATVGAAPLGRISARVLVEGRDLRGDAGPAQADAAASTWAMPWVQLGLVVVLVAALVLRRRSRRRTRAAHQAAIDAARAEGPVPEAAPETARRDDSLL